MTSFAEMLKGLAFFEGLAPHHVEAIAECAEMSEFGAGTMVLEEGEPATHFYLLRAGSVALQTAAPSKPPMTFQTLGADDLLGLSCLAPPFRWAFDARAVSRVEAVAFETACLRAKFDVDHELGYQLMRWFIPVMIQRMTSARLQMLDMYGATP